MIKLPNIFNQNVKCIRCGKAWPPKEAYYDKQGNCYCGMECVRSRQIELDEEFEVHKGIK